MGLLNKYQKICEVGHFTLLESSRCDKGRQAVELVTHWTSLDGVASYNECEEYP